MMRKTGRSESIRNNPNGRLPAIARHFGSTHRACAIHRNCEPPRHEATDVAIEALPEELEVIRYHLGAIEKTLAQLFGPAYDRAEVSMAARADAAHIVECDFDEIVEEWCLAAERGITGH